VLAVVPVKGLESAKSRLAPALSPAARADLVVRMLDRVLAACDEAASVDETLVVTPHPELAPGRDVLVDEGEGQGPAVALGRRGPSRSSRRPTEGRTRSPWRTRRCSSRPSASLGAPP